MKRFAVALAGVVAMTVLLAAGIWLGMSRGTILVADLQAMTGVELPVMTGAEARETMPLQPSSDTAAKSLTTAAAPDEGDRNVLYYRNPMGLPDISYEPKKDSMGMDYIPVYEDDAANEGNVVRVSLDKVQKLGVKTEPAVLRDVMRTVRAVGTVQLDERGQAVVTTKFEGWIEKLHVNTTGQSVKRGQALMDIYSPELVLVQQEYLVAWQTLQNLQGAGAEVRVSAQKLVDAALQRLRNWDISEGQLERLRKRGTVSRRLTVHAPAGGQVMEKMVVEGMRIMPGEPLYKLADLSTVWVLADVFEQDLGLVSEGRVARISVNAYPGETFDGTVGFVYPAVSRETRTAKVRIEIANPDGRLKADMYATVELAAPVAADHVVTVPESAVLDSGTRQAVLVERGEGRYEPREVNLGARADGVVEIREGLADGERVVVSANFLIDAESNLQAALKAFVADAPTAAPLPTTAQDASATAGPSASN